MSKDLDKNCCVVFSIRGRVVFKEKQKNKEKIKKENKKKNQVFVVYKLKKKLD